MLLWLTHRCPPTRSRLWPCFLHASLLLIGAPPTRADKPGPTEYQVKAAYLFNFAKFIEWPSQKLSPSSAELVIGVLGEDPFGDILDRTIQGKRIDNHPLAIQRFKLGDELKGCHLLFVSRSENEHIEEIALAVKQSSVLLVSENEKFLERGGMINFFLESGTVKFAINLQAAERVGLKLSSKLLNVARITKTESSPKP